MASTTATLRKDLSAPGLIRPIREQFSRIDDHRRQGSIRHSLVDTLSAALAMFQFKFLSLLRFDSACQDPDDVIANNLRRLYSLDQVASDTQMREILDPVHPYQLRRCFRALHSSAKRGKVLEDALTANGPHIQLHNDDGMDFIIGIKSAANAALYEQMHERILSGEAIYAARLPQQQEHVATTL